MSTKSSLAHGPGFHLYTDAFNDDKVYLELTDHPEFEASQDRIAIAIPVQVWDVIRKHAGIDLSSLDKTDEEIRSHVERAVDERIERYQASEKTKPLLDHQGVTTYGSVHSARDEQIARGITYLTQIRDHQRKIRDAIAALEEKSDS